MAIYGVFSVVDSVIVICMVVNYIAPAGLHGIKLHCTQGPASLLVAAKALSAGKNVQTHFDQI